MKGTFFPKEINSNRFSLSTRKFKRKEHNSFIATALIFINLTILLLIIMNVSTSILLSSDPPLLKHVNYIDKKKKKRYSLVVFLSRFYRRPQNTI